MFPCNLESEGRGCLEEGYLGLPGVFPDIFKLRFSLRNKGKSGKNLSSPTWPGSPRRPSPRHPRPPDIGFPRRQGLHLGPLCSKQGRFAFAHPLRSSGASGGSVQGGASFKSDSVKRHLRGRHLSVLNLKFNFISNGGCTREEQIALSLKRHLFPHGGREPKAFWICFSRVHPLSETKSNFKFKTLKRHLLKQHLTLSD